MPTHFDREMDKLKKKLLSLISTVEEQVAAAVVAFETKDGHLADSVIAGDRAIDEAEVEIEEECLKILALHQPVALDLRYLVAILKLNNDLERIGDLAANIAEQAVALACVELSIPPLGLGAMADRARSMLHRALDSVFSLDEDTARQVCADDDEVDELHRGTYAQVTALIEQDPTKTGLLIHILSVSRSLERIADLATNIAEDIIYTVAGEIIRHGNG